MISVDSSVAAKWLLRESHSEQARALLRHQLERREGIVAPPLLAMEIANILRQRVRGGRLTPQQAQQRLSRLLALPISYPNLLQLYGRALAIAVEHNLPAIYDPLYLALAEFHDCPLWTADERLLRAVGERFPFLRFIGNHDLPPPRVSD